MGFSGSTRQILLCWKPPLPVVLPSEPLASPALLGGYNLCANLFLQMRTSLWVLAVPPRLVLCCLDPKSLIVSSHAPGRGDWEGRA